MKDGSVPENRCLSHIANLVQAVIPLQQQMIYLYTTTMMMMMIILIIVIIKQVALHLLSHASYGCSLYHTHLKPG